jgi:hypothetical protein
MTIHSVLIVLLLTLATSQTVAQVKPAPADSQPSLLSRQYREGESLAYHMKATNQGRSGTLRYEADAKGTVKKNAAGFVEEYAWSNLNFNGQAMTLPASDFRQTLSLDPNAPPALPDFSHVNPMLIGPVADMLNFYADEWLAIKQGLHKPGDHVYVKHGGPNSWADGVQTILGQDSIDFDVTLSELDESAHTAKVVVRHVPPQNPQIQTPIKWMEAPVADTPNNWVEVGKSNNGKYLAEIGKETFDVELTISLADGKILMATLDNPVVVMARECADSQLTQCAEPEHYQIRRQVEIKLLP